MKDGHPLKPLKNCSGVVTVFQCLVLLIVLMAVGLLTDAARLMTADRKIREP